MAPALSIITPLYNKADLFGETIASVLGQTWKDWEWWIVDNGSTDGGERMAEKQGDARIHASFCPKQGPSAARNHGLRQARGKWVLFLDADDLIKPDYVKNLFKTAEENPQASLVAAGWEQFSSDGARKFYPPVGMGEPPSALQAAAIGYCPWSVHSAMVRRDVLTHEFFWPEAKPYEHHVGEDIVFWFRLTMCHSTAFSQTSGALYRKGMPSSRSSTHARGWFAGVDAALEENVAFLRQRGVEPNADQCETLMRVYSTMHHETRKGGAPDLAQTALEKAEFWLGKSGGPAFSWPLFLRRKLGLKAFLFLEDRWATMTSRKGA